MSSFLIPDAMIDIIVQYGFEMGQLSVDEMLPMCKQIKHDNLHALNKRYGDPLPDLDDVEHEPHFIEAPLNPAYVAASIRCWNYQCMEPPETPDTPANELVTAIEDWFLLTNLVNIHDLTSPVPYVIDDIHQAIAQQEAA